MEGSWELRSSGLQESPCKRVRWHAVKYGVEGLSQGLALGVQRIHSSSKRLSRDESPKWSMCGKGPLVPNTTELTRSYCRRGSFKEKRSGHLRRQGTPHSEPEEGGRDGGKAGQGHPHHLKDIWPFCHLDAIEERKRRQVPLEHRKGPDRELELQAD